MGRWANHYVIGLTGNIGMGKSVVRKMLEHLGAYTIDADGLAHQTMVPGAPAYHPVIETFGKWILDPDGKINRSKLGAVAFSHPEALTLLENVTHPVVGKGIDTLISRARQQVVVLEAIKLIEGPLGSQVDAVWVVDSAPQLQMQRLMEKRAMPELEARKRIEGQNPQREKLARADVVITNNAALPDVWVQVEREWKRLLASLGIRMADDDESPSAQTKVATGTMPVVQPPAQPAPATSAVQTPPAPPSRPVVVTPPAAPVKAATGTMPVAQPPAQPAQPVTPPQAAPSQPVRPAAVVPGTPPATAPAVPAAAAPQAHTPPAPPVRPPTGPIQTGQPTGQAAQRPAAPPRSGPGFTPGVVITRRGMPKNAEQIAAVINRMASKSLNRLDVMGLFGEKSFLLAEVNGQIVGLAGFQVENLITRVDEFYILPGVPVSLVAGKLVHDVEEASKALQSEVGFVYLPFNAPSQFGQVLREHEYSQLALDEIKVPAWREAAAESQPPDTVIYAKKLRAERVLKPL